MARVNILTAACLAILNSGEAMARQDIITAVHERVEHTFTPDDYDYIPSDGGAKKRSNVRWYKRIEGALGTLSQRGLIEQVGRSLWRLTPNKWTAAQNEFTTDDTILPVSNDPQLESLRSKRREEKSLIGINTKTAIREGFVYVVENPAWPGIVKVGCTLDYELRLSQFQTGDPYRAYSLRYTKFVSDCLVAEGMSHELLAAHRVGSQAARPGTGEWFRCSIEQAIEAVEEAAAGSASDI
jgi:hypothetical protein